MRPYRKSVDTEAWSSREELSGGIRTGASKPRWSVAGLSHLTRRQDHGLTGHPKAIASRKPLRGR